MVSPLDKFSQEFGQMQGKLDQILINQATFSEDFKKHDALFEKHGDKMEKHDVRIAGIESKLNWYAGGIATVAAAFTIAGDKIRAAIFGS